MIFGVKQQAAANPQGSTAQKQPAGAFIFDATVKDFERAVMQASLETPVLVDFWAPWCGPCKQLGPMLEQAVREAGGKVLLARVNIDENPELAQAFKVQSVPTVYALFAGQPVTGFTGARPLSEIKMLIDQLVKLAQQGKPGAIDIPASLIQAAQLLARGDFGAAQELYVRVLGQDEKNVQAYVGLIRTLIAAGALDQARQMADEAPEGIAADPQFAAARTALELVENKPDDRAVLALAGRVEKDPADHQARFELAQALFSAGKREEAIDALIEIIRRNRAWEDEKARKELLKFFEAMGPSDPQTMAGRRKLSAILFS